MKLLPQGVPPSDGSEPLPRTAVGWNTKLLKAS